MTIRETFPTKWKEKWLKENFEEPTRIQAQLFEPLRNKKSVLGISPTGSGKTLAYLLPLLLNVKPLQGNQLLILLPSQELASQVAEVVRAWVEPLGLKVQTIIGGANINRQVDRLKKRPEVLVGTPGRVLELIKARKIKAHLIEALVLDEVDDLVSNEDFNAAKAIMKSLMADTQIVAVSATGQVIIPKLETLFRETPLIIDVTKEDETKGQIKNRYLLTPTRKRSDILRRLSNVADFKALVFFNQLNELGSVSERLTYLNIPHRTLASDQHPIERKKAIEDFEQNRVPLLLATDIGARGLDFSSLYYVVQYDLALNKETYIHRSGRVGRMRKNGEVITLTNDREVRELKKMLRELDESAQEIFVSHGELIEEKNEKEQVPPPKKVKVERTSRKEPEKKEQIIVKKKKKKQRHNRNKNKGASWKQ